MPGPHDALFRYVFSQPEHAAAELRAVLPPTLVAHLDWTSLELQPASFVDERLGERQADLLFSVRCDGRPAFVYVLLEHQSTSDPLMAFRVLRYVVRIWDAFLGEHPDSVRLPAVLPVVVHHSKQGWSAATDLCSLLDLDTQSLSLVAPYVPQFRFVLDDLSEAADEALRGRSLTALATAGLMLLARGRTTLDLLADMRRWTDVFGQIASARNGVEALAALLEYAFRVGDLEPEDLRQLAVGLGPAAHEAYMTAAQKLTAESYARGISDGEAKGEAKGKAEGKAELLIRLLSLRFGAVSDATREKVFRAPSGRLDLWAERVLSGASIEEILG